MKRIVSNLIQQYILVIGVFLGVFSGYTANAQPMELLNIALFDLEITGGLPKIYQRTMSHQLRVELLKTGMFYVAERSAMQAILEEKGIKLDECTSDQCAIEAGRILETDKVITGSVGRVKQTHTIILHLIDVETGVIELTKTFESACTIDEVFSVGIKQAALLISGLDNAAWKAGGGELETARYPLPKSFMWPGLGQIAVGRKKTGMVYVIGESMAISYLLISVSNYNGKVNAYKTSMRDYDRAIDPVEIQALYKIRLSAHDSAESARNAITYTGITVGAIYLWNIIDAVIFSRQKRKDQPDSASVGNGDRVTFSISNINNNKSIGISLGLNFNAFGEIDK